MASARSTTAYTGAHPDRNQVVALIQEQLHCSPALAGVMADGGLSRSDDARRMARAWKLTTIETTEAREKGVLL